VPKQGKIVEQQLRTPATGNTIAQRNSTACLFKNSTVAFTWASRSKS